MRIAAMGDLHCRPEKPGLVRMLLGEIETQADVLVLSGDLTDTGLPQETEELARQLKQIGIPVIAILGNHDHESDRAGEVAAALVDAGVHVLDNSLYVLDGVGFVGTKGSSGGFGRRQIDPFGERVLKTFLQYGIDEAAALDQALTQLSGCRRQVVVLHYAPIKETLEGEPLELYPFLGSSRLAEVIDRHPVDVVVHGHAHYGFPQGTTAGGIPVYNVCRFVQEQHTGLPYRLIEL